MLIECRECNKPMSNAAPACPSCGCPVSIGDATVTTERTAKRWKKLHIVAGIIMGVSIVIAALGAIKATEWHSSFMQFVCYLGLVGFLVGLGTGAYASLMTWWFHE